MNTVGSDIEFWTEKRILRKIKKETPTHLLIPQVLTVITFMGVFAVFIISYFTSVINGVKYWQPIHEASLLALLVAAVSSVALKSLIAKNRDKAQKECDFNKSDLYLLTKPLFDLDVGSKVLKKGNHVFPELMELFLIEKYDTKSQTVLLKDSSGKFKEADLS